MFSIDGADHIPIRVDVRPSRPDRVLPWSWPEAARVLLALLAISAAIGLALGRRGRAREAEAVVATPEFRLDPSNATAEALAALPHIGPTLARRIVEAQADGPFRSPEDLRARVRGIGPATLAQVTPYLRIEAGTRTTPASRSPAIAIVDAGANSGVSPVRPSPTRKPPRSRARKAKGSLVARSASAKGGAEASP